MERLYTVELSESELVTLGVSLVGYKNANVKREQTVHTAQAIRNANDILAKLERV